MSFWDCEIDDGDARAEIERDPQDGYKGTLVVRARSGEEIGRQPVTIAYGGPFGPDVADANEWAATAITLFDEWKARGAG